MGSIILCADDFAMTAGISDGIAELADTDRISATSAITTLPSWTEQGKRLGRLRERIAIGLHVNLTMGAPLGRMPTFAPSGRFPRIGQILGSGLTRQLDAEEVAAEVLRQIDRFEEGTGYAPDFIDGHQHVHVLPGVRAGFVDALLQRFQQDRPLVRDPYDYPVTVVSRGGAVGKALALSVLAVGFGAGVRRAGFPTNHGFAGVSSFDSSAPYARELMNAFRNPGPRHLVMCHPGYPDAELEGLDDVRERRRDELQSILQLPGLPEMIWQGGQRDENGRALWPRRDDR
jgi:hypothetical protein